MVSKVYIGGFGGLEGAKIKFAECTSLVNVEPQRLIPYNAGCFFDSASSPHFIRTA